MHIGKALDDRAAQFLQPALNRTEMFIVADSTVANDDIGTSVEDRRDDPGYVFADILPVGVGVDDDVGARGERRIDARAERRGKERKRTRLNPRHACTYPMPSSA